MDKSRANRVEHDKKRIGLIALVAIFSVSICVLGSMIGYKIYTKQSFEQKIESLKKEKDDQLSEGNQKNHFRKGQAEVIAYYPLQGEQVISSVKEIMTQDIKENLEDKENLVFYYTEKQDSTLKGIVNRSVMKQVYDLTSSKVEETEKTSLAKVHLTEDGKSFTLDQLFSDPSKAKEQLIKELTSFLQDKKLEQEKIDCQSIIFCHDATMQERMDAGLRKYLSKEKKIINFAAYHAEVVVKEGQFGFKQQIHGMWEMERYISLLMGEIPRLTDNAAGYGPKGKNNIAHVEIPTEVRIVFEALKQDYADLIRLANPLYASVDEK